MPKGVEHPDKRSTIVGARSVQLSVMPKGVEHLLSEAMSASLLVCNYQ